MRLASLPASTAIEVPEHPTVALAGWVVILSHTATAAHPAGDEVSVEVLCRGDEMPFAISAGTPSKAGRTWF
jgi:hypothetical protein